MARKDFLPDDDAGLVALLKQIVQHLPDFYVRLGITEDHEYVAALFADELAFSHAFRVQRGLTGSAVAATQVKNLLRDGSKDGNKKPMQVHYPEWNVPAPPAVPPGVVGRVRRLARFIRAQPGCTPEMEIVLGLRGRESTTRSVDEAKPKIEVVKRGEHMQVRWGWQGWRKKVNALDLEVDRLDGRGFLPLLTDPNPNAVDPEPLPETPQRWRYRAMYRKDDRRVGQWSDVVEVVVAA